MPKHKWSYGKCCFVSFRRKIRLPSDAIVVSVSASLLRSLFSSYSCCVSEKKKTSRIVFAVFNSLNLIGSIVL